MPVNLAITTTQEVSDALKEKLFEATQSEVEASEVSNLDGLDSGTILHLLQISSSLVSTVVPIILLYLELGKVRKLKLGDSETIENPTKEQLEKLVSEYSRQD